jgi:hypothetical protein
MEICDNTSCQVWMHRECIFDDVLTKTYKRLVKDSDSAEPGTNGASKPNGKKSKAKIWKGIFQAKIKVEEDDHTLVEITDLRDGGLDPWTEPVECLKCGTKLK